MSEGKKKKKNHTQSSRGAALGQQGRHKALGLYRMARWSCKILTPYAPLNGLNPVNVRDCATPSGCLCQSLLHWDVSEIQNELQRESKGQQAHWEVCCAGHGASGRGNPAPNPLQFNEVSIHMWIKEIQWTSRLGFSKSSLQGSTWKIVEESELPWNWWTDYFKVWKLVERQEVKGWT